MTTVPTPRPRLRELLPGELIPDDPQQAAARRTGRDWFVDSAFFLIALGFGALLLLGTYFSADQRPSPAAIWFDVSVGLVCSVALWWRRRWLLPLAVVMAALSTVSAYAAVPATIMVFAVAVHRRTRVALAVGAVNLVCGLLFLLVRPQHDPFWLTAGFSVLFLAGLIAWGMFVRARRQLVLTLRERAERAEAEQRLMADQARAAERTRIAREMHDVLAHRVSLVALHAGGLEVRPDLPPEEVRDTAALIRTTARQTLEELRGVIGVLRDGPDDVGSARPEAPQPTLADVHRLVAESRQAGAKVELVDELDDTAVPTGIGRDAYRVVQEALTNVNKHARGTATMVSLGGRPGEQVLVRIENRLGLQASSALPGAGVGLIGLAERIDLAGGEFRHGPDGAGSFVVEASLPWPK